MKKKGIIIFSLLLLGIFLLNACNEKKINNSDSTITKDTTGLDNSVKEVSKDIVERKDTIIQDFKISYTITETDDKVYSFQHDENGKKEKVSTFDKSVELNINQKSISVFGRKISKYDFKKYIPDDLKEYELSVFNIGQLSDEGVVFFINICKPDSDECYAFSLTINKDRFEMKEIDNGDY